MLILPVEDAKPGTKLALSVFHPAQPGTELLRAGFVLDEPVLERLRDLGVQTVYVDYPGLDDLDRYLAPAMCPSRLRMFEQVKRTFAAVERTARPSVPYSDYYAATRELVITLMGKGAPHAVYLDEMSARMPGDEVQHAAAVAHLSLTLGLRLEPYIVRQRSRRLRPAHAREVVNLGVAGMLHDIGKAKLPAHLRTRNVLNAPEGDVARQDYESHARLGAEMLRGGIEASATAAVLHHHQRFDGAGYPPVRAPDGTVRPLAGQETHVFARIVGAADLFDRLTTTEQGQRRPNVEVLHLIRTAHAARVDPEVLRVMSGAVPPFPPGSKVVLADGTSAIVTALNHDDPYRPVVRRLQDDGWTVAGEPVNLATPGEVAVQSIGDLRVDHMIPPPTAPKSKADAAA